MHIAARLACLGWTVFIFSGTAQAAVGRTAGTYDVSAGGEAVYSIPFAARTRWTCPFEVQMDTLIAVGKAPRRMRTVEEKVAIVAQTLAPGPMRYSPDAYDKETRITGRVRNPIRRASHRRGSGMWPWGKRR
jgi:hypothetical protein